MEKCNDTDCLNCQLPRCVYDTQDLVDSFQQKKRNENYRKWRETHVEYERERLRKWYAKPKNREHHKKMVLERYHAKKGAK